MKPGFNYKNDILSENVSERKIQELTISGWN